jgi:hypothetical protein
VTVQNSLFFPRNVKKGKKMTHSRLRLRICGSCPNGRNLIVDGKAETFCNKQVDLEIKMISAIWVL